MDSKTILICDDDPTVRSSLSLVLKRAGYGIATAETPEQAVAQIRTTIPGLILMDMNYTRSTTGEEGLELLAKVKVLAPEVPVILITAWGSIHLAVQGIRAGAFDFITKPWNNLALLESIRTAIQVQESSTAADAAPKSPFRRDKIIGKSPLLERVLQTVSRIASTHAPVLITGESGTGKELFAQSIHNASFRANGPFVAANFASIPESLIESELFGYEEGAFTGAVKGGRQGLFRSAHKGTLFLDEIGDASLSVQSRLLRAIEEKEIMPVGSARAIPVDVRIICATNRDLLQMVRDGQFRQDLYYRIKGGCLHIPPLRERTSDILEILQDMTGGLDLPKPLEQQLLDYYWPGNIRELRSIAQCLEVFEQNQQMLDENMRREVLHSFFESLHPMDEAVMLQEEDKRILQAVDEMNRQSRSAGRYSLAGHPLLASCGMTESKIKLRLKRLEKNGYLYAGRTRQGVSLTEKGKSFLQAQETDN